MAGFIGYAIGSTWGLDAIIYVGIVSGAVIFLLNYVDKLIGD